MGPTAALLLAPSPDGTRPGSLDPDSGDNVAGVDPTSHNPIFPDFPFATSKLSLPSPTLMTLRPSAESPKGHVPETGFGLSSFWGGGSKQCLSSLSRSARGMAAPEAASIPVPGNPRSPSLWFISAKMKTATKRRSHASPFLPVQTLTRRLRCLYSQRPIPRASEVPFFLRHISCLLYNLSMRNRF